MSKSYRNVDFVTNGWGGGTNYSVPGPMGTQFASPYGDPYRVQAVNGFFSAIGSSIVNIGTGIGKIATPLLPVLAPITGAVVGGLLTKAPTAPTQTQPQSQFTVVTQQTAAEVAAAEAEKRNTTVYLIAGGAAVIALFYFLSRRK